MSQSFLFVPANNAKLISGAPKRGADHVILDLEDSVPLDQKQSARTAISGHIAHLTNAGCSVVVRVNGDMSAMAQDFEALQFNPPDWIMIPKAQTAGQMLWISQTLAEMDLGNCKLIALIECANGVLNAREIAAIPQVATLALGPEDYSRTLGHEPTPAGLTAPAQSLIWAARAHGKLAIVTPDSIAVVQDAARFTAALEAGKAIGTDGILCIHPKQVDMVRSTFAPSAEDIAYAERVVASYNEALQSGKGAVMLDGKMIDKPVVDRAQAILKFSDQQKIPA
jgi:citrate lyase subunit beta/citryl-CoA lyase